jgi:hypothetical protein
MPSEICKHCKQWTRSRENTVSVRLDYFRHSDQKHVHVPFLYYLCMDCTRKVMEAKRNPSGAEQESLFE